ncbi:kinase [Thraustotheca clavata]|uniref:Kinase n=1 Tax=Thraustotheca clavata TaxID=74557 RepID=A0A1W0AAL4_9STRA|nr:kinase [Thraustotheca clavata]
MQGTVRRAERDAQENDVLSSLWNTRGSANSMRLHSYENPKKNYVEVKIGGHKLDHKHAEQFRPTVISAPMKSVQNTYVQMNQTPAFGVHHKEKMNYVEVKIGGHKYDHMRCMTFDESLVTFNDQLATIERGALGCALCQGFHDAPLIQLYCRHAVCPDCFKTMSINKFQTKVMCGICFQKVPFLRPSHRRAVESQDSPSIVPHITLETTAFAVACAGVGHYGPKVVQSISHALRNTSIGTQVISTVEFTEESLQEKVNAIVDMDGAERWQNRIAVVLEPSKLLKYNFIQTLGRGNFSEVMLMQKKSSEKYCVLKESDKLQEAMNEVNLLSKLKSPHIVRLDNYFIEQVGHLHYVYLELEYCNRGTMHDYIKSLSGQRMDNSTFARIMLQLCSGLAEIHRHSIVHRDIKPDNLLYTSDCVVKISDFGVSTCLATALVTRHAAGTMAFMAPEVRKYFLGESVIYDWTADIWSLGAVAVAFLLGTTEPRVTIRPVDDVIVDLTKRNVPLPFLKAIEGALHPDPKQRASLSQIADSIRTTYSKL